MDENEKFEGKQEAIASIADDPAAIRLLQTHADDAMDRFFDDFDPEAGILDLLADDQIQRLIEEATNLTKAAQEELASRGTGVTQ